MTRTVQYVHADTANRDFTMQIYLQPNSIRSRLDETAATLADACYLLRYVDQFWVP